MLFFQVIRAAFRSIMANKMRTFLTLLGVVIGVAAVIAMLSIGEGAKKRVTDRISTMGTNMLRVRPGAAKLGYISAGSVETLMADDAEAIRTIPGVALVTPTVSNMGMVKFGSDNATSRIRGTSPEFIAVNNFELAVGRYFGLSEVTRQKKVAVLGYTVREDLFDGYRDDEVIGKTIKIEGQNFLVIGVFKEKGQTSWRDPDDQVFIPYTTSQKRLFAQHYVNDIYMQIESIDDIPYVKDEVDALLRKRHRVPEGVESDFSIRDYTEFVQAWKDTTQAFTVLLGGIAAVSLLVGGIGVMNIMLVSVTERTREIGVRMAVGARRRDIMRQFMIEAVVITLTGGVIGIGLGIGIAQAISVWGEWDTIVTSFSIVLGFAFSVMVGLVFGIYPASKASKLDPIEALRYE